MAPPTARFRPGRYLATFAALVVVLYTLVFALGDHKATPKLGIDLQGGTQVTLTARTETGAPPTPQELDLARQIIEQRVNGLGVSGAEVVRNGNNLDITVPGRSGDQARTLGQTARLFFRPVAQGPVPAGGPAAAPGGGAATPGQAPGGRAVSFPRQAPAPAPQPPAPAPSGGAPPGGSATSQDPRQAQAIEAARAQRQSTDPAVQLQALQALDCHADDPLRGYDDPSLPLVACQRDGSAKFVLGPSILPGTEIGNATASPSQQGAGYTIDATFKSGGARTWADYTAANVGKQVAFSLDSQVVSAPVIQQAQPGGNSQITGNFNQQSAQDLANVLKYGSLPLSFDTSQAQTISATLGYASLQAGLVAGAIGLILVFAYSLLYYRALGVLTVLSLILSGVLTYAVLVLLGRGIGFTLDLSGVAGFIVAIGITADSFVIFFERIKDEVREGRTFRSAVPRGWVRARRTILSGDAVSFLAAVVLYALAVGQVRGFAFTLGLSTLLDLVIVFLVTHPLLSMASHSKLFASPAWSGLGAVARTPKQQPGGRRAPVGAGRGGDR